MSKQFYFKQFILVDIQTVQIQTIQFSISEQFSSIWPINRTLPGPTNPGQSGRGNDEGVLRIPQSSNITGTPSSDCSVSYTGHSFGSGGVLLLCRKAVDVFYSPSRLGNNLKENVKFPFRYKMIKNTFDL